MFTKDEIVVVEQLFQEHKLGVIISLGLIKLLKQFMSSYLRMVNCILTINIHRKLDRLIVHFKGALMKKFTIPFLIMLGITGCNSGGGGGSGTPAPSPSPTPTPTPSIPLCIGHDLPVNSFVPNYTGEAKVIDEASAQYPTYVNISSFEYIDQALNTKKIYGFKANESEVGVVQNLIYTVHSGGAGGYIYNAVQITNYSVSNPNVTSGSSVTISVAYTILPSVPTPLVPGNYTANFTCIRN